MRRVTVNAVLVMLLIAVFASALASAGTVSLPLVFRDRRLIPTIPPLPTLPPTPTPTPTPAPVARVIGSSAFVPEGSDYLYIVGQVRNDAVTSVRLVTISAELRDASGHVIAHYHTLSMIDTLSPGMTSPFHIIIPNPPTWASYETSVRAQETSQVPHPLEVLNSTDYWDEENAYHVAGEIRNQHGELRTFIRAFVTLYDATGQVIGVAVNYTAPHTLNPGETASFDTKVSFWKHKPDKSMVRDHLLQVYDD